MKKTALRSLYLFWLLAFLLIFNAIACGEGEAENISKEDFSNGLEFSSNGDGTCTLIGKGTCTDDEVVIPSKAPNGETVTYIGRTGSFLGVPMPEELDGFSTVTSVTIPDSVISIKESAFKGFVRLEKIAFGKNSKLEIIGRNAFEGCTGLTNIIFPQNVTRINREAFLNCTGLTSVTIPDGIDEISKYAFLGCTSLIQNENGVSYVDKWVINCDTSVVSVIIRDNTIGICSEAFYECENLESIVISDKVKSIGYFAFAYCKNLKSVILGENSELTRIGSHAFIYCRQLKTITIPKGITRIEDFTFFQCNRLNGITIPDGVTSIGYSAFKSCRSMKSINIPNNVTHIGANAFFDCEILLTVYYDGTEGEWNSIGIDSESGLENIEIIYLRSN